MSRAHRITQTYNELPAIGAAVFRNPAENIGSRGSLPSSLDTTDQVGIIKPSTDQHGQVILPWEWGATRPFPGFSHDDIKKLLAESLHACGRESEANSVENCYQEFKIGQCNDCLTPVGFPVTCDNRLCPDCNSRRAELLISEHKPMLSQIHNPKMLTLTKKPVEHITKQTFKEFRDDFTKLRHRKIWKNVCWGSLYSFETKRTGTGLWYVHLHAVIASGYIEQSELSQEWEKITDCPIVDIRAIKNDDKWAGIREVVKYPSKVSDFINEPELVDEFLRATQGVNLVYGTGALYRVKTKRHGEGKMRCPICGGHDIEFAHGWGFHVHKDRVRKIKRGYTWLSGPSRAGPGEN